MPASNSGPSGLDAALLAARRGWFGVLYLLSRESKASTAAFVVTTLSDLIQFSVFPITAISTLAPGSAFAGISTVMSVTILDVDTLFALADAGGSTGRAVLFWAALGVVMVFLGMLAYVVGILLSEGRQQAIVLRLLGASASVLTTVAFMPASSLLLSVFHGCASVEALGVACNQDGQWVVMALVVVVLAVFTAVSTFFASVYIDTDLTSSAWGAKVTGRVDAAMLLLKLLLVTCFTTLDLPPAGQAVLAGVAAAVWLCGTIFAQPFVQPTANSLAAAAAALNLWLVLVAGILLAAPGSSAGIFIFVGLLCAPVLGFLCNGAYRSAVISSDFASLRSALQVDIWARGRVFLAQTMSSATGHLSPSRKSRSTAPGRRGQATARPGRLPSAELPTGEPAAGTAHRGRGGRRTLLRAPSATSLAIGGQISTTARGERLKVQVLADEADEDCGVRQAEPVTTSTLLPGVSSESLLSQAGMAYDEMLKTWPKSAATYASGSIFHRAYGSTVSSELTILAMARKQVGGAWDVAFLSYQRTRQLQERTGSGLSAVDRILFEEAWSAAVEDAIKCFSLQNRLFGTAVETVPDAGTMGALTSQLYTARTAAEQKFQTMLSINPESIMALRAYSRFCDEVLGDTDRAAELRNKASRIEDKHAKTNVRSLDAVTVGASDEALSVMDEMNAVVTMTGDLRRYGEITDINLAGARLFGRARSDLVGQSVSALFPEPLGLFYDAVILSYLSPHDQSESFARGTHVSVALSAGGYLTPVRVSLQEGAGSELDVTPCLSMVVQRAPTKRRVIIVGGAEAGFPVLAMDAESSALLCDSAADDGADDGGSDAGGSDTGVADDGRGRGRAESHGNRSWAREGFASEVVAHEMPLLRWVPDLGRLAASALGSASGAQAELSVEGTMYNEVDAGSGIEGRADTGTDAESVVMPSSASDIVDSEPARGSGRRRGPLALPTTPAVRLRFCVQALHREVLGGKRPVRGAEPGHWIVSWEAPRPRAAEARPAAAATAAARVNGVALLGRAAGMGPSRRLITQGRRSSTRKVSAAAKARRPGRPRRSSVARGEPDAKQRPGQASPVADGLPLAASGLEALRSLSREHSRSKDGVVPASPHSTHLLTDSQVGLRSHIGMDITGGAGYSGEGAGSVASSSTTAQGLTRKIVDSAMSKPDPLIRGVSLIVMASLAAVIIFACVLAVVVPSVSDGAKQLLKANDMAQRRSYNADVSMGKWYQLISVSLGFTAIDDWETLTANLTSSIDRYEAAHRELLAVAQNVNGRLNAFEQDRGWDVCTSSSELYICDARESMSASDFVEFTIFHLRQLAALPTGGIALRDPADPRIITGYHKSLFILVPNIDLMATALDRARNVSAGELADGLRDDLGAMTVVLVVVAVVTFTIATLGTTFLVSQMGRLRHLILASLAQVPRHLLRAMAQQTEQAQAAFTTAIGADSGDDEALLHDVDTPRGSARNLLAPTTARAGGGAPGTATARVQARASARSRRSKGCCGRRAGRRVTDSSCFVLRTSCNITAPLALTAVWVAIILLLINRMFQTVVIDAARSGELHRYAGATSALRGQIEVTLLLSGNGRSLAMTEARTNSTAVLQSLGAVLNGAESEQFHTRLAGLADSDEAVAAELFQIIVHDSCRALEAGSWERAKCRELHDQYGLRGLHSFTTAMLDDGVQARAIFSENSTADDRDLPALLTTGAIFEIIPPMQRYSAKSAMSEILLQHVVNMSADSARDAFASTWSDIQLVLGLFAGGFVVVIWAWALPAIRGLVAVRASLLTLLRSLPEQAILSTPAVSHVVSLLASVFGMAQAGRAMESLVKAAEQRARAEYSASQSSPDPRFSRMIVSPKAAVAPATGESPTEKQKRGRHGAGAQGDATCPGPGQVRNVSSVVAHLPPLLQDDEKDAGPEPEQPSE